MRKMDDDYNRTASRGVQTLGAGKLGKMRVQQDSFFYSQKSLLEIILCKW